MGEAGLPSPEELHRAARLLAVRSRREVSSLFTGSYRSAFRGGGYEFDESRPYAPGDDVRSLDWNAMARTGVPFVKRFREERDQTVLLVLDHSASMRFGTAGRSKAEVAAHAAALLAGAAGHAGDRVGLVCFEQEVRQAIAPARGEAHLWRVLQALAEAAAATRGTTNLAGALARARALSPRRSVMVLLSDFRDEELFERSVAGERGARPPGGRSPRAEFVALARSHDLVAAVLHDAREEELPDVGTVRVADPERPGAPLLLRSGSARARSLYRTACAVRRRALERRLRSDGADVMWLRSDRDPLQALARFFRQRHRDAAA